MNGVGLFTKDFQIALTAHLARDPELFRETIGYLHVTDLELTACQLVLEALRQYNERFGKLPDMATLQLHLQYMIQNVDGTTQTQLAPEEYESLAYVLGQIAKTTVLNSDYYREHLPSYLRTVRVCQVNRQHAHTLALGGSADDFVNDILQVSYDIQNTNANDLEIDDMMANPEYMFDRLKYARVTTGVSALDRATSGGLGLKEIGMLVACPGVGKTTGLLNFQAASALNAHRGLFFNLELPSNKVKWRQTAIMAGIPANWFKIPVPEWPSRPHGNDMLRRLEFHHRPDNPHIGHVKYVHCNTRALTLADIDVAISRWMEGCYKQYGTADDCTAVYVDWLDRISHVGLRGVNRNTRDDVIVTKIGEELGNLARKHNVALWTATQGTRDADGREVLKMKDTAFGYHKNDPLDISVGIGVVNAAATQLTGRGAAHIADEDNDDAPPCNRQLKFNIMKNRDNSADQFEVYQGPTLRFFGTSTECTAITDQWDSGQYITAMAKMTKKRK